MISVEEAKEKGITDWLSKPMPDFVITSKADKEALANARQTLRMATLLNNSLVLSNYTDKLKTLIFTFLILYPNHNGVQWNERKYHKRSAGEFSIDIKVADYEGFCKADEREALAILARETLRGAAKFLSKEKHFDHEKFLRDLEDIFRSEEIL